LFITSSQKTVTKNSWKSNLFNYFLDFERSDDCIGLTMTWVFFEYFFLCYYLLFIVEKMHKYSTLSVATGIAYQYLFNELHLTCIIQQSNFPGFLELYFRLRAEIGILCWCFIMIWLFFMCVTVITFLCKQYFYLVEICFFIVIYKGLPSFRTKHFSQ